RKAEFERQLATVYAFDDDEIRTQAVQIAEATIKEANEKIARRSEALGIPRGYAPSISVPYWLDRGQDPRREHPPQLIWVAYRQFEQDDKEAKLQIDRPALEIRTRIIAMWLGIGRREDILGGQCPLRNN